MIHGMRFGACRFALKGAGTMIFQASARTDIPAFYLPWLCRRLDEGFVRVRNPYDHHSVHEYALTREGVDALVLETKDPRGLVGEAKRLAPFCPYFIVTMTPYGSEIEPFVPHWSALLPALKQLAADFGPQAIAWRYAPVLAHPDWDLAAHQGAFSTMARALKGTAGRVIVGALEHYTGRKANRWLPSAPFFKGLLPHMRAHAHAADMRFSVCGAMGDAAEEGCISIQSIVEISGRPLKAKVNHAQRRPGCHCLESRDIGAYGTCPHGCVYCYAQRTDDAVQLKVRQHDPLSPFLIGWDEPGDVIHRHFSNSFFSDQQQLF